jgi:hypothetical protein
MDCVVALVCSNTHVYGADHMPHAFHAVVTHAGHTRPVVDLAYSPITEDGFFLISACKDGKPILRNGTHERTHTRAHAHAHTHTHTHTPPHTHTHTHTHTQSRHDWGLDWDIRGAQGGGVGCNNRQQGAAVRDRRS